MPGTPASCPQGLRLVVPGRCSQPRRDLHPDPVCPSSRHTWEAAGPGEGREVGPLEARVIARCHLPLPAPLPRARPPCSALAAAPHGAPGKQAEECPQPAATPRPKGRHPGSGGIRWRAPHAHTATLAQLLPAPAGAKPQNNGVSIPPQPGAGRGESPRPWLPAHLLQQGSPADGISPPKPPTVPLDTQANMLCGVCSGTALSWALGSLPGQGAGLLAPPVNAGPYVLAEPAIPSLPWTQHRSQAVGCAGLDSRGPGAPPSVGTPLPGPQRAPRTTLILKPSPPTPVAPRPLCSQMSITASGLRGRFLGSQSPALLAFFSSGPFLLGTQLRCEDLCHGSGQAKAPAMAKGPVSCLPRNVLSERQRSALVPGWEKHAETWHMWQKDVLQLALASQTPAGAPDPSVGTSSVTMQQASPSRATVDVDDEPPSLVLRSPGLSPSRALRPPMLWSRQPPSPLVSEESQSCLGRAGSPGQGTDKAITLDARSVSGYDVEDGSSFLLTASPDWWLGSLEGRGSSAPFRVPARSSVLDRAEPSFLDDHEPGSQDPPDGPLEPWSSDVSCPSSALREEVDSIFPDFFAY
ncbi:hypothetical protein EI555_013304 [Monodon monoceros]|uniref:Uncharacterized protein n=1 Tax=Monodon monoceros TaxID=40151 RepID=A0A4V5PAM4_MONMO|nr:hypothetical protein EI555_013304 [Monodon monoceros]